MIELVKQYPELFARFLSLSGTSLVLVTDESYTLTFCNESLMQKMHLPQDPIGAHLESILCPLENEELSLNISSSSQSLVPQIFQLCTTDFLYRCYSYKIDEGYLILGDKVGSTENEILESMSHLNNELSQMSRELSKKNRELQRANIKITQLARTDYLTGLSNRSYFQERFKEIFALTQRHELELTILLADLDHFKRINDTYGHDVGDKVLQAFGSILIRECRTEDLPARYGGEELIIMLPKTASTGAVAMYERLRDELLRSAILPASDFITFSAGIAVYEERDTESSLLKKADDALYEAKNNGRDSCVVSPS